LHKKIDPAHLELTPDEERELQHRLRSTGVSHRIRLRARIILEHAHGLSEPEIAQKLGVDCHTVYQWTRRFEEDGVPGLADRSRAGSGRHLEPEKVSQVMTLLAQLPENRRVDAENQGNGKTWNVRRIAQEVGMSHQSVYAIWRRSHLYSRPARFARVTGMPPDCRFWDVAGVCLHPPLKALALCCDGDNPEAALDPPLTAGTKGNIPGQSLFNRVIPRDMIAMFACLCYLDHKLTQGGRGRDTDAVWLRFLKQVHRETPAGLGLHIILDYPAPGVQPDSVQPAGVQPPAVQAPAVQPMVQDWLARHPRIFLHHMPDKTSWLDLVEGYFATLTAEKARTGSFAGIREMIPMAENFLIRPAPRPNSFLWRLKCDALSSNLEQSLATVAHSVSA
jgi:transposase